MAKQFIAEAKRMQQLAGIIKENIQFDEDKLKKYYEYLLNLGGGDLGGDYGDMLNKAKDFSSVEEFIEDDINILATDDKKQADTIRKWVEQNIIDGNTLDILSNTLKNLSLKDFIKVIKMAGDYDVWVSGAKQMDTTLDDKTFRGETISTFEEDDIKRYNQALTQL
jgi:hypothetical protein